MSEAFNVVSKDRTSRYFAAGPQDGAVFHVRDDISAEEALEMASTFLSSAESATLQAATELNSPIGWTALYLVEVSQALVHASLEAPARARAGKTE